MSLPNLNKFKPIISGYGRNNLIHCQSLCRAAAYVSYQPRQEEWDGQTDRTDWQTDVGRWAGAVKPGQQRTRVMLSHSSHTARLDPGKDRGRRVREQGSRGEAKKGENWAGGAGGGGVGWCSAGGEEGEVIKRRSCGVADIYVCVCVCVRAGARPWVWWSGWCGGGDERPQGEMGKDDQWQTTSCHPDTLETHIHTLITPETFLFRIGSGGQTENKSLPPPLPFHSVFPSIPPF